MLLQPAFKELFDTIRMPIVRVSKKRSVSGCEVQSLSGSVFEVVSGTLSGDFSIEVALGVFLSTLIPLINGNRNRLGFDELNNVGVCKDRRTVDHSVVSGTAQRVPIHRPDKQRLLCFCRGLLSVKDGSLPGNCSPQSCVVRLQFGMQSFKFRLGKFTGVSTAHRR